MHNRLHNCKNQFQTETKRVLCLCSAGLLRSPTAANVLHKEYGYNTRAAGVTEDFALIPVDDVLLEWADEIVCVEAPVWKRLAKDYAHVGPKTKVLNIPDMFSWGDPELEQKIKEQYEEAEMGVAY